MDRLADTLAEISRTLRDKDGNYNDPREAFQVIGRAMGLSSKAWTVEPAELTAIKIALFKFGRYIIRGRTNRDDFLDVICYLVLALIMRDLEHEARYGKRE